VSEGIVAEGVLAHLGERLRSVRPLGGGCIGEVYRAELEDGTPLVAKVDRAGESHLDREAYMLRYLREKTDLPVPEVFHGSEILLLMEFVEGTNRFSEEAERHAAEPLDDELGRVLPGEAPALRRAGCARGGAAAGGGPDQGGASGGSAG
jgi:predicted unusual protein kinase regulating ubiquinone biosynthesis (AarF/ABC1/UbiB family)